MSKKILYIGNKLSKHGNTETSIETLGSFLETSGYEVYYASSIKNKLLRFIDMCFTTMWYAKKVNFILIDTYSTQNFWYALFVSQIARLFHTKYIAKLHGGNLPERLKKNPILCDLIFKNSFKNVAPSHYLLQSFKERYPDNTIYIPNTINLENYPFFQRNLDEPRLLWVRSFANIYNPELAIQVFAQIKKEYPNATLCMIGPDKENMLNSIKQFAINLNLNVDFTGKLSKQQWIEKAKQYTIFINTTNFDNTPISVIEAMALGLPVVSTNVGGIPYLIENKKSGLLVEKQSVNQMADAILLLMNDNNLVKNITYNAYKSIEDFDWKKVQNLWSNLLN